LVADQRAAAPVLGDQAPEAVLDLVPLAGAGWEVADRDRKAGLIGELLQLQLPELEAVAVAAAAVGGDLEGGRVRVASRAELLPPAADRGDREGGGLVGDADVDEALVGADVVDAEGDRLAELLVGEVVHLDRHRIALATPLAAA